MKQLSVKKTAAAKVVGSVYYTDYLCPPGIMNVANNCYASSLLHCLINHPIYPVLHEQLVGRHALHCDKTCVPSGQLYM